MRSLEGITKVLSEHKQGLKDGFKVKEIGIFGSYARNEQREDSDVDILVEFEEPISLEFVHLAELLESILGMRVDLVSRGAIKPNRWKYVEQDLIYV